MAIGLACAWRPRGEGERWSHVLDQLRHVYATVSVAVPPDADEHASRVLERDLDSKVHVAPRPFWTRHTALRAALETGVEHVHYADGDRLLRWIETRDREWQETVAKVATTDCLIIGRSRTAFESHPRAMQQTEAIINAVGSHLLGMVADLGGGSRGLRHGSMQPSPA